MNHKAPPPIKPATPITVWPANDQGRRIIDMWDSGAGRWIRLVILPNGEAMFIAGGPPQMLSELVADIRRLLDAAVAVHEGTWQG